MAIKAHDTFWQRRILGKDSVSTSEFLMASITEYRYTDDEPYSLVSRASNEHVTPQTSDLPSMRTSATKEAP